MLRKVNAISLGSKGWDLCLCVGYKYAVGIQARIGAVTTADTEKCPLRLCEELHIQFHICFSVSPSSLPSKKKKINWNEFRKLSGKENDLEFNPKSLLV